MRLTRFGLKGVVFYLAMIGGFYASPYSNLFFLLLGFLTLQWVLVVPWTLRNMRGVTASVRTIEPTPAGAGQSVRVLVGAPGRVRFQVTIELELEGGEVLVGQADVVDGETSVIVHVPPLPRGLYQVRRGRVASTYPLGLLTVRREIEVPGELVVYPTPIDLAAARGGGDALSEALGECITGAGDLQPSLLRDHREGDELRTVHWRATARRGSLVVKEYEGGGGEGLEVLIDRRCTPAALEQALSTVSAIIGLARSNKVVLAIHSQGLSATFGPNHLPWHDALRFLAGADTLDPGAAAPPPVSPSVTRLPLVAGHAR